ncbi:MAG: PPC domain-containing DNA-binding protein [Halanaerobium sp.]|nr:PPC domain-containing DNA-binding protein [Halanaerobium sp.]
MNWEVTSGYWEGDDRMEYRRFNDKYILRLERGEEIVAALQEFCQQEEIELGWVQGIGAVGQATIGLFETAKKEYHSIQLQGDHEITSLCGNISTMDGEVYLHLHITLADDEYRLRGGHLSSAVISATGELVVGVIDGRFSRQFSEEVGLNLYSFSE